MLQTRDDWTDQGGRERVGLPTNGPAAVITNMAVVHFDETTKEMYLSGTYLGISPVQVIDRRGFTIDIFRAQDIRPPSPEEAEHIAPTL
jgi:glutaconate CoA-transferase subunit B